MLPSPLPTSTQRLNALIELEHITKKIVQRTAETVILNGVSFSVPLGSLFAINGPSGSGKSTLLNIMTGIDRPTGGRILFAGQELHSMHENQLARWRGKQVGIVFQFFQLLPTLTAEENVLLALELGGVAPRKQWRTLAAHALQVVAMFDYKKRLPAELSGGQQQRVAIARALVNDPPLLIADEPTGNLDSRSAQQVFELLESLVRGGKTVVFVTHDPTLAARATHGIHLLDGQIDLQQTNNTSGATLPYRR